MDIFRIIDRFKISERGMVYIVKPSSNATLHIGDILLDLQGNRFKLKELELRKRITSDIPLGKLPMGILPEPIDGCDVKGNLLVRSLSDVNFLFCNHPLYPHRVDEDYEAEYQVAA